MNAQNDRQRFPSGIVALVLGAGLACSGCTVSRAADKQVLPFRTANAVAGPAETATIAPPESRPTTVAAWGRSRIVSPEQSAPTAVATLFPEPTPPSAPSTHFRTSLPDGPPHSPWPAIQPDSSRQTALPPIRPVRVDSAAVGESVTPTVVHASTITFEQQVLRSELPVLVDFYADWCGPCRAMAPALQEVAEEASQTRVVKVNIDESPELAARFGIDSVPSLLVFKQGRVVVRQTGAKNKAQLKALLGG